MDHKDYWRKQGDEPLFPDILWSRPQTKHGAGKLAIIGGNSHGFGAPGMAYNTTLQSGVGVCQVLLPDAVKKVVKSLLPDAGFAPSTPSGSFSRKALDSFMADAAWSDAVLLSGDAGRNSETAMLLESFVEKYSGLLTITQDAVDYFKETPQQIIDREQTLIVLSIAQLQKMFIGVGSPTPITLSMNASHLAVALRDFTLEHAAGIVTKLGDIMFIAHNGQVVSLRHEPKTWRVETAARASVFWMQNPSKLLEAVASAIVQQ